MTTTRRDFLKTSGMLVVSAGALSLDLFGATADADGQRPGRPVSGP